MRDVPEYRRLVGRPPVWRRRTAPWGWFLLGVIATLAIVAFAWTRLDASRAPKTTSLPDSTATLPQRTLKPLRIPITGPARIRAGTIIHFRGRTPLGHGGPLLLKVSHNGSPWVVAARGRATPKGRYRMSLRFTLRGRTHIRIVFANGNFAYKWFRVV